MPDTLIDALSPSTSAAVRRYWNYLEPRAQTEVILEYLLDRYWKNPHDHKPVIRQLLGAAGLVVAAPRAQLWTIAWDDPLPPEPDENVVHLKQLHTLQDTVALTWVYRHLGHLEIPTDELRPALESLLSFVFESWKPTNWAMALHLRDEGLLSGAWIHENLQCSDVRVARHLELLCNEPARHVTTTQSIWHLDWGNHQYPL